MPKITELSTILNIKNTTSFVVADSGYVRRLNYSVLATNIINTATTVITNLFTVTTLTATGESSLEYSSATKVFTFKPPLPSLITTATNLVLGGVKAGGANISIANDGVISSSISIATSSTLGGIKIGTGLSINSSTGVVTVSAISSGFATTSTLVNGTSTVTLSSTGTLTLPVSGDIVRNGVSVLGGGGTTLPSQSGNSGKYLTTNGSSLSWATVAGGGFSRSVSTGTTTGIPNGSTNNITITGFKSYSLLSVQTSAAAWVRLYTTSAARSSDSSRSQGTDPTPGAGVIAEIITTGTQIQLITPGVIGFNNDDPPATTIYAAVANLSGGFGTISVTLKLLQLEA